MKKLIEDNKLPSREKLVRIFEKHEVNTAVGFVVAPNPDIINDIMEWAAEKNQTPVKAPKDGE